MPSLMRQPQTPPQQRSSSTHSRLARAAAQPVDGMLGTRWDWHAISANKRHVRKVLLLIHSGHIFPAVAGHL